MIKSISVKNQFLTNDSNLISENTITLSLSQPWTSGLVIESITGIGPVKATINNTDLVTLDGALFNSSRQGTRNIVIDFSIHDIFNNNGQILKTIEEVRHLCYTIFPPKQKVILYFNTDTYYSAGGKGSTDHRLYIEGWVESNEANIFTNKETQQVSIICPYPYFKSMATKEDRTELPIADFQFLLKDGTFDVMELEGNDIAYIKRNALAVGDDLTNCWCNYSFPPGYDINGEVKVIFVSEGIKYTTTEMKKKYVNSQIGLDGYGNVISNPNANDISDDLFVDSLYIKTTTVLQLMSFTNYVGGRRVRTLSLQMVVNGSMISSTTPWNVANGSYGEITFPDYIGKVTELGDADGYEKLSISENAMQASFIPYDEDGTFMMSHILPINIANIFYDGEITTGALFTFHITGDVSNIRVKNLNSDMYMEIDTSKIQGITGSSEPDLLVNDIIYLSTVYNNKYIRLHRNGKDYQILGCLPKDTTWLDLQDGDNMFLSESDVGATNYYMDVKADVIYNGI